MTSNADEQENRPDAGANLPAVAVSPAPLPERWSYVAAAAVVVIVLVADIFLPRGATAAIGYCLVPVIGSWRRRPRFLLGMTALCTVLTAVGFLAERAGGRPWMSLFDRAMVVGVLWLTFLLVRRRAAFVQALLDQTQALRDVTGELRRSNAALERFASVVAHDLRGPLGSIGLQAELLAQTASVRTDPESIESVRAIQSAVGRMGGLIESLLTYARAGARDIRPADCDCASVLADVNERLKADLDFCGARVETAGALPVVRADPVLVAQLFQNLIENSIKYRGAAPLTVHVSAAPDGLMWRFTVRDNGRGIRPEHRERIFAPFTQAAGAGNSNKGGVGLGLATCKRIVERHGGRIWVQSNPGEGAAFVFTIPDRPGTAAPPAPAVVVGRLQQLQAT